ncbi:hypothetical protein GGR58DRAFT_451322 [Xylaria digitata]|nr:hypothetical protein GGR58DRAFT_451322 [Xylaria digitata]
MYICGYTTKDQKDLKRHTRTKHNTGNKWAYRCRCGHIDARKDNYLRHTKPCNREHVIPFYICKCGAVYSDDKEKHINHVKRCKYGFGHIGRPSAS